jgi:hypothetical protein
MHFLNTGVDIAGEHESYGVFPTTFRRSPAYRRSFVLPMLTSISMDYAEIEHYMDCAEEFTIASAMELFLTDNEYPNPLECFEDEYSDPDSLIEMYHEMREDMSDDECDCDGCLAERGELEDLDDELFDESDDELDDDSMPDLEDN